MKYLIISITCILFLIVPWSFYISYASHTVKSCDDMLTDNVVPAIESGDWEQAKYELVLIKDDWDSFKEVSVYFIDTPTLNEVDYVLSETSTYIAHQDDINAFTCISTLRNRLNHLYSNQALSLDNVF